MKDFLTLPPRKTGSLCLEQASMLAMTHDTSLPLFAFFFVTRPGWLQAGQDLVYLCLSYTWNNACHMEGALWMFVKWQVWRRTSRYWRKAEPSLNKMPWKLDVSSEHSRLLWTSSFNGSLSSNWHWLWSQTFSFLRTLTPKCLPFWLSSAISEIKILFCL